MSCTVRWLTALAAAFGSSHAGDRCRATGRFGSIRSPRMRASKQRIEVAPTPDISAAKGSVTLGAKASCGLPVFYEADYGPVVVRAGRAVICEVPARVKFPIECRVTAFQIGRRVSPTVSPAEPAPRAFNIVKK